MARLTLKEARGLAGLSQLGLDDAASVPRGTTFDLESGRNRRPAYDTVVKLVRALQRAGLSGLAAEQVFPVPTADSAAGEEQPAALPCRSENDAEVV